MNPRRLLVLALVLSLAAACGGGGSSGGTTTSGTSDSGGSGEASTNTWVGKLTDSEAYIAIMKEGTQHLIYLTDGKNLHVWFEGNASGAVVGYFTFYNDEGGSIINNPQGSDGFAGTVTVAPGQHFKYSAVRAKGDAGLYRAKETVGADTWDSAWIVLNDGSLRGARRNAAGKVEGLTTRAGVKWTNPAADP